MSVDVSCDYNVINPKHLKPVRHAQSIFILPKRVYPHYFD